MATIIDGSVSYKAVLFLPIKFFPRLVNFKLLGFSSIGLTRRNVFEACKSFKGKDRISD